MTSDIAYAFGTPPSDAEAIKCATVALGSIVGKDESVEVPSVGGRPPRSLQRQTLAEVIEPRLYRAAQLWSTKRFCSYRNSLQQGVNIILRRDCSNRRVQRKLKGLLAACAQRVFPYAGAYCAPLNITGLTDYARGALLFNGCGPAPTTGKNPSQW